MQAFQDVVDHASAVIAGVDAGRGSAGKLAKDWQSSKWAVLPREARNLLDDTQNAHGTIDKVLVDNDELTNQLQTTRKRIDDIMGAYQAGQGTAGKLLSLRHDFDQARQEFDSLKTAANSRIANIKDLQRRFDLLTGRFDGIVSRINAGQGTLGQFAVNPQLSEALGGTSNELQGLMKAMRANPKKFFTIRLGLF